MTYITVNYIYRSGGTGRKAFLDNPLPKGYTGFILKKDG